MYVLWTLVGSPRVDNVSVELSSRLHQVDVAYEQPGARFTRYLTCVCVGQRKPARQL